MIPPEGQILEGLDEFMLRTGHLTVVCSIASSSRCTRNRLAQLVAEQLLHPVAIDIGSLDSVSEYIAAKRLCRLDGDPADSRNYRYPSLVLTRSESTWVVSHHEPTLPPEVSWQDLCLAAPDVASRVGAITAGGKHGSKTGLSHVLDWATKAGLLTSGGQITPDGQLIACVGEACGIHPPLSNPYRCDAERLALAAMLLPADMDVFARFATELVTAPGPIHKRDAAELFARSVQRLADDADSTRFLAPRRRYRIDSFIRELERASNRSGTNLGGTSTAWHRASSRLETYVDLGFMQKGTGGPRDKYEYVYTSLDRLRAAVESLRHCASSQDWLEAHLARLLYGETCPQQQIGWQHIQHSLQKILQALRLPPVAIPIGTLAIGIACIHAHRGEPISIGAARAAVVDLARQRSDCARLARGTSGDRAEFVTINAKMLAS